MPARRSTLPLIAAVALLSIVVAAAAHAAPAPLARREAPAEPPPVRLSGSLPGGPHREAVAPFVIGTQAGYQALASEWRIASPPKVDFRTQVLVVTTSDGTFSGPQFVLDGAGDLGVVQTFIIYGCWGGQPPEGVTFRLTSFSRSAVRSVNGMPVAPTPVVR
jgi:hypothetical protein